MRRQEYKHPYPVLSLVRPFLQLATERKEAARLLSFAEDALQKGMFQEAYRLVRQVQSIPGYERDTAVLGFITACGAKGKGKRTGLKGGWYLRTLEGHGDTVYGISFSPNGTYGLSGSADRTIRLWDIATGQEIRRFEGHTHGVTSVSFSPDGRYALSGGVTTLRLWDIETGQEIRRFEGQWSAADVSFSPDGRYALSGSEDRTIRLWKIETGKEIRRLEVQGDSVHSVSFSPDGRYALSGGADHILRLWEFDWEWEFSEEGD